jgi:hypothetical protein
MSGCQEKEQGDFELPKFYWWEVYLRLWIMAECDLKFWKLIPIINLSFYKWESLNSNFEIEIGWLCFEMGIRRHPKVTFIDKKQIVWKKK